MTSLTTTRTQTRSSELAARRAKEHKKDAVVLIMRFLCDHGYTDAYQQLCSDSGLSLERVDVADNMDLLMMMQEFEGLYEATYGRRPKLTRSLNTPQEKKGSRPEGGNVCVSQSGRMDIQGKKGRIIGSNSVNTRNNEAGLRSCQFLNNELGPAEEGNGILVNGHAIQRTKSGTNAENHSKSLESTSMRVIDPLPTDLPGDLLELAQIVKRDILQRSSPVAWTDVAGLETAKQLLKEAVVLPMQYPEYFTGILTPWKGVLLYGPPGTGKTMLARAVATECGSTFFNIPASTIISKWRGDSEKLVRVLFHLANHYSPSVIFMDEVDALMFSRGGEGEHEASRRMKTELMIQLDGLSPSTNQVVVLAASNRPWELDVALLRRMEKKIYIPLPDIDARKMILQFLLQDRICPELCLKQLALRTEGFSGFDLVLLAKEAGMRPLRRLIESSIINSSDKDSNPDIQPITEEDMAGSLEVSKPSSSMYQLQYEAFSKKYGQRGDILSI